MTTQQLLLLLLLLLSRQNATHCGSNAFWKQEADAEAERSPRETIAMTRRRPMRKTSVHGQTSEHKKAAGKKMHDGWTVARTQAASERTSER